jgi:hypothetical protein
MSSSGMWCRMALVRTDVSEGRIASAIRVTRIGEPGTTLEVTSNQTTLPRNTNYRQSTLIILLFILNIIFPFTSMSRKLPLCFSVSASKGCIPAARPAAIVSGSVEVTVRSPGCSLAVGPPASEDLSCNQSGMRERELAALTVFHKLPKQTCHLPHD